MLEWKPKYKSETNIADNGTSMAEYRLRVKYGMKTAIAITGVKFGGWGINLLAANAKNIPTEIFK